MPKPVDSQIFRGMVKHVADCKDAKGAAALEREISDIIDRFREVRRDIVEKAWLEATYPSLAEYLEKIPNAMLQQAQPGSPTLEQLAAEITRNLIERFAKLGWIEAGLTPAYEGRLRQLCPNNGEPYLARLRLADGAQALRFSLAGADYWPLLHGKKTDLGEKLQRAFDSNPLDDLIAKLKALRIAEPDVGVLEQAKTRWTGSRSLHIPPRDAALLYDAYELGDRADQLLQTQDPKEKPPVAPPPVCRFKRAGAAKDGNYLTLPPAALAQLRGVGYDLTGRNAEPTAENVAEACRTRLQQRGEAAPDVSVDVLDGCQVITVPTDQAQLLLAPTAVGDPAGLISSTPKTRYEPEYKGFSGENCVFLIEAAHLIYQGEEQVQYYARQWGLDETRFVAEGNAESFVSYDPRKNAVVLAFRGTQGLQDALDDANGVPVDAAGLGGGSVHGGFKSQYEAVLPRLQAALDEILARHPGAAIMLGGHSLGGSLAALFGAHLMERNEQGASYHLTAIYTCGQPGTGTSAFNRANAQRAARQGVSFYRVINNNDIVPHLPGYLSNEGFGVEMYLDRYGVMHPPGEVSGWEKVHDRAADIFKALVSGRTFVKGIQWVVDHRYDAHLALARKNRTLRFAAAA